MSTTWKSSADALRDLSLISDFGGTNEVDLKLDLIKGTEHHTKKTPCRFVDPRTGEELEIRGECRQGESDRRGKLGSIGRGKLIEEFRHSSKMKRLQEQLRMNRPLGFGNNMIESYFGNGTDAEESSPTTSDRLISTVKTTAVREKGKRKNVLISSLLEKLESNDEKNVGSSILNHENLPVIGVKKSDSSMDTCEICRRDKELVEVCSCKRTMDQCPCPKSYKNHSRNESVVDD